MTKGETIAVVGVGVALLSVMVAGWADTRTGLSAMRGKIDDLRVEVKQDIAGLRGELKQDFGDLRAELKEDIAELRADVRRLDDRVDELNVRMVAVEIHTGTVARKTPQGELPNGGDAG